MGMCRYIYLDESNIGGLFTETLTADVETVFADETGLVGADTAVGNFSSASCSYGGYVFNSIFPAPHNSFPFDWYRV